MHERLSKSEVGVSEEIRQRVERTFHEDNFDLQTRELAGAVMWMADQVQRDTNVPWHDNPRAHEALSEAIVTWLGMIRPAWRGAVSDLFGPDDPQTLGRAIARHYGRFKDLA